MLRVTGYPLLQICRWLLLPAHPIYIFQTMLTTHILYMTHRPFLLSIFTAACSAISRCWWYKLNVWMSPAPPEFFYNIITNPAVIHDFFQEGSSCLLCQCLKLDAFRKANLSPHIANKFLPTFLPPI